MKMGKFVWLYQPHKMDAKSWQKITNFRKILEKILEKIKFWKIFELQISLFLEI